MKHVKLLLIALLVFVLGGCGLLSGTEEDALSASENITPAPTVPNVQAIPAASPDQQAQVAGQQEAQAPLPTAVTLPPTAVPPEPTVDRSQPTTYVVQTGDVLGLIAERFDADIAELRRINGLSGNLIKVGQELTIPAAGGATTTDTGTETAAPAPTSAAAPAPTSPPAPVTCPAGAVGHCVQTGENLSGIASKYGVAVDEMRTANPSISGDLIRAGDVLTIPGQSSTPVDPAPTSDGTAGGGTVLDPIGPTTDANPAPASDADCKARNFEYPFFHAADGKCYANPIGGATTQPTAVDGDLDQTCPAGYFLYSDGRCYPIPGETVTVEPTPSTTSGTISGGGEYGRPPCREGYVELTNNQCWPTADNPNPATVTPVPTTS